MKAYFLIIIVVLALVAADIYASPAYSKSTERFACSPCAPCPTS